MRYRPALPRLLAAGLTTCTMVFGLLATPALAAPFPTALAKPAAGSPNQARSLPPTGTTSQSEMPAAQRSKLPATALRPQSLPTRTTPHKATPKKTTAASCTPADFGSRSGAALVSFVEASTIDCINTLFAVTGTDAHNVFQEAQMVTIANAFQNASTTYPGDDSTAVWQLVLFLRAGYYVQYYDSGDVGSYDATLTTAVQRGIDTFVASSHFTDVSAANGDVAGDVIILTDSANLQARYLNVYKQVLTGYNSSYDAFPEMDAFVNDVYTPLFRGHQNPDFITAVTADPSIIDTLNTFALNHLSLLGGANSYLDSNAGLEMARFLSTPELQAKVRPLALGLLNASSITGRTAPLWVSVAEMTDYADSANCSYYSTCNLVAQLTKAALPITYACDSTRTIEAQALTSADLAAACSSLQNQDPYFHSLVKDSGPIPNQYESTIHIVVFASPTGYQTYAGAVFGVDTNNGGITLTGDPTDPTNQPTSIMYQKSTDDGFVARIWNLNHEYTHYLDARYDTQGNFTDETTVPDVWWIEGLAEYVSYSYRKVTDTEAISEAANHTYALSTLFQNTYANSDETRTYPWGYLAVRYMFEKHPADIANMLAHFRVGDYTGGYAVYNTGIGTRYDADFNNWLTACAAGACAAGGPPPCAATDTRAMDQNCSRADQSASAGDLDYFYIYLPAGTTQLTVTTTGGTGNPYLYYDPTTWATNSTYTAQSTNAGSSQNITVTNTTAGYRYISLYANTAFSGVTITTQY